MKIIIFLYVFVFGWTALGQIRQALPYHPATLRPPAGGIYRFFPQPEASSEFRGYFKVNVEIHLLTLNGKACLMHPGDIVRISVHSNLVFLIRQTAHPVKAGKCPMGLPLRPAIY